MSRIREGGGGGVGTRYSMIGITKCPHLKTFIITHHFCHIGSIMKRTKNSVKYEVFVKQYLRAILDISDKIKLTDLLIAVL